MRTYTITKKEFRIIKDAQEILSLVKAEYDAQYKDKKLTISDSRYRDYKLKLEDLDALIERLKAGGK